MEIAFDHQTIDQHGIFGVFSGFHRHRFYTVKFTVSIVLHINGQVNIGLKHCTAFDGNREFSAIISQILINRIFVAESDFAFQRFHISFTYLGHFICIISDGNNFAVFLFNRENFAGKFKLDIKSRAVIICQYPLPEIIAVIQQDFRCRIFQYAIDNS